MKNSIPGKKTRLLEDYEDLVEVARGSTTSKVRKNEYLTELSNQLNIYFFGRNGTLKFVISLILGILIFVFASLDMFDNKSREIALLSSTLVGYFLLVWTATAAFADVWIFSKRMKGEKMIFSKVAKIAVNKYSLWLSLVFLFIIAVLNNKTGFAKTSLYLSYFWTLIGISMISSNVTLLLKIANDFIRIISTVFGNRNSLQNTGADLIDSLRKKLKSSKRKSEKIGKWKELVEMDLTEAESRFEFSNLVIALLSILIAIFFSDALKNIFSSLISVIYDFVLFLVAQLSEMLFVDSEIQPFFETIFQIGIFSTLIIGVAGISMYLLGRLTTTYFQYYRPAYALKRALVIFSKN